MARTRKQNKKNNGGKSRSSATTMGKILPPVNITNMNQLSELDKRIQMGPLTLVFVYADWCGHCQRFKPTMDKLENVSGRTIQTARIRDDMLPKSALANTPIEGYPSVLLIKNNKEPVAFQKENGEITTVIPEHNDQEKMTAILRNAGTPEGMNILKNNSKETPVEPETLVEAPASAPVYLNTKTGESPLAAPIMLNNTNNALNKTLNKINTMNKVENSSSAVPVSPELTNSYRPIEAITEAVPPEESIDRLSANELRVEKEKVLQASTPLTQTPPAKIGGGLYQTLSQVAYQFGPAAALLFAGQALGSRKTKKKSKSRR
jgi:thiol-disulfide isomerase/thioredoxin